MTPEQQHLYKKIANDKNLLHKTISDFLEREITGNRPTERKRVIKELDNLHQNKKLSRQQQETILQYSLERS